jgi:hypothetical protein
MASTLVLCDACQLSLLTATVTRGYEETLLVAWDLQLSTRRNRRGSHLCSVRFVLRGVHGPGGGRIQP